MDAMTIEDYNESVCGLAREKVEPFDSVSDAAGFLQGEVSSGRRGWDVVRREVSLGSYAGEIHGGIRWREAGMPPMFQAPF